MAKPITKYCVQVHNPQELPQILEEAFRIALEGRPGPVLIDIPMDVQRAEIQIKIITHQNTLSNQLDENIIDDLANDILYAKKPLILVGRGVKAGFAQNEFDAFVKKTKVPVITTLLGIDTIAFNDEQRIGFVGSYGNRWANIAFGECDLLIVLGARLDIRQTGADTKFIENRKIYHIDCESAEINNRVKGCIPIVRAPNFKTLFENLPVLNVNQWSDVNEELLYNTIEKFKKKKKI
jgi:acetolactate synthase-1/2/3 large subunit